MNGKSVRKNYLYNLTYQGMLLVVPLIVTPYVARVLGADGTGTYSYILSVVSYFVIFATLGTITFGQREISYVQSDIKERSTVFWETFLFRVTTTIAASIAYFVFCLFQKDAFILYMIFILNILAVMTDITWFFQGLEEFGKIIARNAVFKIINILFIFLLVKSKDDLELYVFGMCFIPMIGNLLLWVSLPKFICKVEFKLLRPFRKTREIISLFIPTIAIQVYTVLDKTMIGIITRDSFQNGYYDQAEKLAKMTLTVVTSLGIVLIPRIGAYFSQNKHKEIQEYMYRSYRFVWMLGLPLCFGLIGVAPNLIPWFLGPGYDQSIPLLRVLSLLILAIGINNVTGMQYLIPTKRQNIFTLTVCIGAGANLICNIVLIPMWGAMGAAFATVLAESIIAIVQIVIVRNELQPAHIVSLCTKYVIAASLMLIIIFVESSILKPSIVHTIVMTASGAASYFLLLIILQDSFFLDNLNRVLEKLHIRKE